MTLKKNIFDRLSLKKKITLNRQNKISEQLSNESEKNANLIEQIKDLQSQRVVDNSTLRSGYFLKSQNWYSQKLIEELNQTETKQKFIKKELTELQKKNIISKLDEGKNIIFDSNCVFNVFWGGLGFKIALRAKNLPYL